MGETTFEAKDLIQRWREGQRYVPIWIGAPEATAIAYAQQGVEPPRPLTHDLVKNAIEQMGGEVQDVVINNLLDHTYYAVIRINKEGELIEIDSRPSDAIAAGKGELVTIENFYRLFNGV